MMVKVAPYKRWDTIAFVHYWKFLLGRALHLEQHQMNALKDLIDDGLHINLVERPEND